MTTINSITLIAGLLTLSIFELSMLRWEFPAGKKWLELLIRYVLMASSITAYLIEKLTLNDIFLGIILMPMVNFFLRTAIRGARNAEKTRLARKEKKNYAFDNTREQPQEESGLAE